MARKASQGRGGTPATAALVAASIPFATHSYRHDTAADSYGVEAALALDVDPARVLKTLVAEVDGQVVVAAVPVDARLDLKALATAVGGKRALMAEPATAERVTGYVVGGISPIGQRTRHATVIDSTAMRWPTVYVSGGKRGFEIELAPGDLLNVTMGLSASISR